MYSLIWNPYGIHTMPIPYGLILHGFHMESMWSLCGFHMDFIWIPCGMHLISQLILKSGSKF